MARTAQLHLCRGEEGGPEAQIGYWLFLAKLLIRGRDSAMITQFRRRKPPRWFGGQPFHLQNLRVTSQIASSIRTVSRICPCTDKRLSRLQYPTG